jgi:hypothetical protein
MDFADVSPLEELPSSQIRRLDVALTTWDGEVGHDQVVKAHQVNGVEILERGKARYLGFTGNKVNVVGWTL